MKVICCVLDSLTFILQILSHSWIFLMLTCSLWDAMIGFACEEIISVSSCYQAWCISRSSKIKYTQLQKSRRFGLFDIKTFIRWTEHDVVLYKSLCLFIDIYKSAWDKLMWFILETNFWSKYSRENMVNKIQPKAFGIFFNNDKL